MGRTTVRVSGAESLVTRVAEAVAAETGVEASRLRGSNGRRYIPIPGQEQFDDTGQTPEETGGKSIPSAANA